MTYALDDLKKNDEAPQWLDEPGLKTLLSGYLLPDETPRGMYSRVAKAAASYYSNKDEWEKKFFDVMWKNWLCPASPVLSNLGVDRGLPISCNSIHVADSVDSIFTKSHELATLSKNGAGVGIYFGDIRARGESIKGNGKSEGIVPWCRIMDQTTVSVSQGCYDDKTEILTEHGWKKFSELSNNMKVAQSTNKGDISFVNYTDYISYDVNENLIRISNKTSLDLLVTKNHRMAIEYRKRVSNKRDENGKIINHEKIQENCLRIIEAEKLNLHRDTRFWCAAKSSAGKLQDLTAIDRFHIAYQADGSTNPTGNSNGNVSGTIIYAFHFSKERKIIRLRDILKELNWEYTENISAKNNATTFLVRVPLSVRISKKFNDIYDIKDFSTNFSQQFIYELGHWDGSFRDINEDNASIEYLSTIEMNTDFIQSVAFISGKMSNRRPPVRNKDYHQWKHSIYICNRNTVGGEDVFKNDEYYSGKVYCVTVPTGLLVVRRNGFPVICGNSTRRGASAIYLPIDHGDIEEFINIRRPVGDINRRCLNLNHGVCISNSWMESMLAGDKSKRKIWEQLLLARVETGEPYIFFKDNVNKNNPECYKKNNLDVKTSNICCLAGDTKVLTNKGHQRIDILTDKTIKIFNGKNWVETSSFSQRGTAPLYRIHIANGSYVDCTDNHRWFMASSYSEISRDKYTETLTTNLEVGQWLEYHDETYSGEVELPSAYLKGFLLGDGTHTGDRPKLNLHSVKYECLDSLLFSAEEAKFGKANTNAITKLNFGNEVINPNVWGQQIFREMKGLAPRKQELIDWTTTYRNGLPTDYSNWSFMSKCKFISGLLDADGTIGKKNGLPQISNKNESFINDIQVLLKSIGITSNKDFAGKCYRLSLSVFDTHRMFSKLETQRLIMRDKKPNRKSTGWRRIVKIEKLEGVHPVYCPTIPTTGKFALANGLMTGNSEITLYTDPDHTFVCCLSSLNLVRWDEWKDTDLVNTAVRFLDAVLQEYINKTENMKGMEASRRSAIKGRAIGIGVLGWHTLLQEKGLPFDSFDTMQLNAQIFKSMRDKADQETVIMAKELGEPEWCKGFGRRHSHCLATAPTVSNSTISGGHSAGIEPFAANIFVQKSAKGTFIRKNTTLEKLLEAKGKNTLETWASINEKSGSVQHLTCLTSEEKEVFLTAREINQHTIIKLAAQRQKWIDQGQSLNLFFASNSSAKYIHDVHIAAWKSGLKTLYYLRSEGVIKSDLASRSEDECKACEA